MVHAYMDQATGSVCMTWIPSFQMYYACRINNCIQLTEISSNFLGTNFRRFDQHVEVGNGISFNNHQKSYLVFTFLHHCKERVWLSLSYTLSLWLVFPCPRTHSHARTHWSAYHMLFWVHSLYSLICYLPISCPDLLCSYLLTQILSLSSYAHFFIHTCTSPCMWTHSHLAGSKQQWIITL